MEDIVLQAEKVMKHLMESSASTNTRFHGREKKLTTSQIRKFLTAVNTVTNKVNVYKTKHLGESLLSDELAAEVKYLKVKIIYQAGREGTVRAFVNEADLLKKIDSVGNNIKKYDELSRYIEALVAYHKFYGGKD